MRRWFLRVFWFLVLLVVLYVVLARGLITWIQYSPKQVVAVADTLFNVKVEYQNLEIDQTWSGFEFHSQGLNVQHPAWRFQTENAQVDFHLLSLIWPGLPFGERLVVNNTVIHTVTSDGSTSFEPDQAFMWLAKLWRHIQVRNLSIYSERVDGFSIYIDSFNASLVERWVVLADIGIRNRNQQSLAEFQVSGHFAQDRFMRLRQGQFNIKQKSSSNINYLKAVWPEASGILDRLPSGEAELTLIGEVADYHLSDLNLNVDISQLNWGADSELPESIGFVIRWSLVSGNFQWGRMQASLTQVEFDRKPVEDLSPILLTKQGSVLSLVINQLNILPFSGVLDHVLGGGVGQLQAFELVDSSLDFDLYDLRLERADISVQQAIWVGDQNRLDLSGLQAKLDRDLLEIDFTQDIQFDTNLTEHGHYQIRADKPWLLRLSPDHQAWSLGLSQIQVNEMVFDLEGAGRFDGNVDVKLYGAVGNIDEVKSQLLPYPLMFSNLSSWLKQALLNGESIQVEASMAGNLKDFPFSEGRGELKARAIIQNTELKFNEAWPSVKDFTAYIDFKPFDLRISSPNAKIYGADARDIQVDIKHLDSKDIAVEVSAFALTDAQNGLAFLLASPIASNIGIDDFIKKHLNAAGQWRVDLHRLFIPVRGYDERKTEVDGNIKLSGQMTLFNQIQIDRVVGDLAFTRDSIWTPGDVAIDALGGTHKLSVKTDNKAQQVLIEVAGDVNLADWHGFDGQAPLDVLVKVPFGGGELSGADVSLNLAAQQLTSRWPYPLNQDFIDSPLNLELQFEKQASSLKANIENRVDVNLNWSTNDDGNSKLSSGFIQIGETVSVKSNSSGIKFIGQLDYLNLDQWLNVWSDLPLNLSAGSESSGLWLPSSLSLAKLDFLEQSYPELRLDWRSENQIVRFYAKSSYADIEVAKSPDAAQGLKVDVNLLHIKSNQDKSASNTDLAGLVGNPNASCLQTVAETTWPKIKFQGQNILIGERLLDSLVFEVEETETLRRINGLTFEFANRSGKGEVDYAWMKELNDSRLNMVLKSDNVAALSKFIGFNKGFTGKNGQFNTELAWDGELSCFSLANATGRFSSRFDNGVIEQVEPGLARLIGLLSVDSIVRRLKLDLKDVTNKGMEYDRIDITGQLEKGSVSLDALKLSSPGLKVGMNGTVSLLERQLDLRAEVTPAVGSALPALAGIIGFANPVTGVIAYVVAKNLPFINEDIISYDYRISGDWVDPKIESKGGSFLFKDPGKR